MFLRCLPLFSLRLPWFSPDVWNTRLLPKVHRQNWRCLAILQHFDFVSSDLALQTSPLFFLQVRFMLLAPTRFRRGWSVLPIRLFSSFGFGVVSFVSYCFFLAEMGRTVWSSHRWWAKPSGYSLRSHWFLMFKAHHFCPFLSEYFAFCFSVAVFPQLLAKVVSLKFYKCWLWQSCVVHQIFLRLHWSA